MRGWAATVSPSTKSTITKVPTATPHQQLQDDSMPVQYVTIIVAAVLGTALFFFVLCCSFRPRKVKHVEYGLSASAIAGDHPINFVNGETEFKTATAMSSNNPRFDVV